MGIISKIFGGRSAEPAPASAKPPTSDHIDQSTPTEITPTELRERLASDNPPLLIDVREAPELAKDGVIPGSVHMPMSTFEGREDELPRDRPLALHCAGGVRSHVVGCYLLDRGFGDVLNLTGGIQAWDGEIVRG